MATDISPQLAVRRSVAAVEFYKEAFGAPEMCRVDDGAGHGATTKMLLRVVDPHGDHWEIGRPAAARPHAAGHVAARRGRGRCFPPQIASCTVARRRGNGGSG